MSDMIHVLTHNDLYYACRTLCLCLWVRRIEAGWEIFLTIEESFVRGSPGRPKAPQHESFTLLKSNVGLNGARQMNRLSLWRKVPPWLMFIRMRILQVMVPILRPGINHFQKSSCPHNHQCQGPIHKN